MAFYRNDGIGIAGIACAVPDNLVSIDSFKAVFGDDVVTKFSSATGIKSMYKALPEQTASDLAYSAAENLLDKLTINREEIGMMIFVTQSPDYRRPSSASVLQKRLNLSLDCACMEINLGCSGFIYGLQTATSMMINSNAKYTLLLQGETASKLVNPQDKSIVMMYGDAGSAVLLERKNESSFTTLLRSDGNRFKSIILPAGGFRDMNPTHDRFVCSDGIERSLYDIFMDGTSVFSFSITDVPKAIDDYLKKNNNSVEDFDVLLLHQANSFILKQVSKKIKFPKENVLVSIDRKSVV